MPSQIIVVGGDHVWLTLTTGSHMVPLLNNIGTDVATVGVSLLDAVYSYLYTVLSLTLGLH